MRRTRRTATAAALLAGLALVVAACGDDDDDAQTTTSAEPTGTTEAPATTEAPGTTEAPATTEAPPQTGGNPVYAPEQEFTTYNNGTADGNALANAEVLNEVLPDTFIFNDKAELQLEDELMDSAELTSESPQTVVYKVNSKAVWSDGEPIDCDDFYLAWVAFNGKLKAKNPDGTVQTDEAGNEVGLFSPAATTGYEDIESVECSADGKEITTTYAKNFADWKSLFTGLMPAHVVEKQSGVADIQAAYEGNVEADLAKIADFWNNGFTVDKFDPAVHVSGDQYTITGFEAGNALTLSRNEKYWGTPGIPDTIVFRLISDATAQPQALQNGEVDLITPQPNPDLLAQLEGMSGVTYEVNGGYTYEHVDFNFSNPIFQDKAVREAFALCLPRQEIIDKLIKPLDPEAVVMGNRYLFPFEAAYVDNSGEFKDQNIDEAKARLEAAGWTLGGDGVYTKGDLRLEFRMSYREPNPRRQQQIQLTAAACAQAGMKINEDPDPNFFSDQLPNGNHDVALFAWVGSPLKSGSNGIFVTGGDSNYGKYTNPELDKVLAQILTELDEDKLNDLANEADKIIWSDLATIPIFQFPNLVAHSEALEGVVYNPTQQSITWNANQWSKS